MWMVITSTIFYLIIQFHKIRLFLLKISLRYLHYCNIMNKSPGSNLNETSSIFDWMRWLRSWFPNKKKKKVPFFLSSAISFFSCGRPWLEGGGGGDITVFFKGGKNIFEIPVHSWEAIDGVLLSHTLYILNIGK